MKEIDKKLKTIDGMICKNIDNLSSLQRGGVAQNILAFTRNLVEHVALKAYSIEYEVRVDYSHIKDALNYIVKDSKYLFLRKFHKQLQESISHYTPTGDGAERLVLKYYEYYLLLRSFVKNEYCINILSNLDAFPLNIDKTAESYYIQVLESLKKSKPISDLSRKPRLYVMRSKPVYVNGKILFENTLVLAKDTVSKFDRFIAFSKFMIPDYYAIRASIWMDQIQVQGQKMPIYILNEYEVAIRPCEINNFARIFGKRVDVKQSDGEYKRLMEFLKQSGASITDIVCSTENEYNKIKSDILLQEDRAKFFDVLDEARNLILKNKEGSNIVKYLLYAMRNKVIKNQYSKNCNPKLSKLNLCYGCIPFDQMPFVTSLINHNPEMVNVIGAINPEEHKYELAARHILINTITGGHLYTNTDELTTYGEIKKLIELYNSNLYHKHKGRRIDIFGKKNAFIKEHYDDTYNIINDMIGLSYDGVKGYKNSIMRWLEEVSEDVICSEKRKVLTDMFEETRISIIYGAAGTGKTYLLNHISKFFNNKKKLYLANTHPAVDNLKRKIEAQNCKYLTISKFVKNASVEIKYDIIFIDESSTISNSDMRSLLNKAKFQLLVLTGDTQQIESISFGNWFELAKYFIPKKSIHELTEPFRTKNKELLDLWSKVRKRDEAITEHLVHYEYSTSLDSSIFQQREEDEIILCLNYNGLYGINNINRFLQNKNPNRGESWGVWTYKINDPVLFNEVNRFSSVIYNNLKGTIVNIKKEGEKIWFEVELETVLNELDIEGLDIELLQERNSRKSIVGFWVYRKEENEDGSDGDASTTVPFQIAYAVSIHKAQGLEYDSVKVVITQDVDDRISHNIFYTAITRAKKMLKIYWSPESMQKVISGFSKSNIVNDANIFSAHSSFPIINKYF